MSKKAIWVVALLIGICVGGAGGFFLGAATGEFGREMLKNSFSSEQIADVDNAQKISRQHFGTEFPGNWNENVAMDFYEPEHFVSIDSPGGSNAIFLIYDETTDPAENLKAHEKEESASLKKITKKSFSQWGQYTGKGVELNGKGMGIYPTSVRIFAYSSKKKSFVVIEQRYGEDESKTASGFDLIEKNFQLKGA